MDDHHHREDEATEWDQRYASAGQVWSGLPNGSLVNEVDELVAGRALDVGCGEGADAVWLANRGWQVTALDVSELALRRASDAADRAGVKVQWLHAGLLGAPLVPGSFDLVSAHYPALRHTPDHAAERALIQAVAPGGLLLVVHHALDHPDLDHHADLDTEMAKAHGFNPADYVSPGDVAALLDETWQVAFDPRRPRDVPSGAGAGHAYDVVLRAQRTQHAS
jgi:SAM-dependent methyltransferase